MKYLVYLILISSIPLFSKSWNEFHIDRYDNLLNSHYTKGEFNGGVLVGSSEAIFFKKMYGHMDLYKNKELDYDTSFRLASVSKIFTGLSIMILHEEYSLNYDSFVHNYIEEFPYENITIRHLLTHTSGLSDYTDIFAPNRGEPNEILKNQDVINYLIQWGDFLKFTPGDKYDYSNTNYVVLSELIYRISGLTYEDFLMEKIFKPLSMTNSRVYNLQSVNKMFLNRAKGFHGNLETTYSWLDGVSGDGAVFSSVNDLYIFYKALKAYRIVSRETFEEGIKPHVLNSGEESYYGFGIAILEDGSLQHGGGWLGARTFFQFNFHRDEVIIALDSSSSDILWNVVAYEGVKLIRYITF